MERSGGIPYALVYVQDTHIESFAYPYHLNAAEGEQLLDLGDDYNQFIPQPLKKKIIIENKEIHEFIEKKKIKS